MYAGRPWDRAPVRRILHSRRQQLPSIGSATSQVVKKRGLSVAFDLATHRGYDS